MTTAPKIEAGNKVEWTLFFATKLDAALYVGQTTGSQRTVSGRVRIDEITKQEYVDATTMEGMQQRMPRDCVRGCWRVWISGTAV